jgi:DNA-binding NtrC family response regulator
MNGPALAENLIEAALFGHKKGAYTGATQDAPGYFASADSGTIFLDEIGELPLHLQPKLLRILESQEYSPVGSTTALTSTARVIAATNANLAAETAAGTFRSDLYARLAGHVIEAPPLRQRRSDIPFLARRFFEEAAPGRMLQCSAGFVESLCLHRWPMNVRELKFTMKRLASEHPNATVFNASDLASVLLPQDRTAGQPTSSDDTSLGPSREELENTLVRCRGNVAEVAETFRRDRKQVYRWLRRHSLDPDAYRR